MLLHVRYHVIIGVLWLGVHAVGVDTNELYTLISIANSRFACHFIRTDHIRAMVAGKKDDERLRIAEIVQRIRLAIRSW
ncbi:hypothetical protein D3C85_1558830 [compost metagenome]